MGEASTQADLVILTILPEETSAVVAALSARGSFHQVLGTNLYRWRSVELASNQGKLRVIVGSSGGAGNDKMQAAATDGLQRFEPHVLLVVGVAGGIPKGNDPMCAGDIVMGDAIWSIDRGSIDEKGLHVRPASQSAGWGMLPGMQNIALDAPDWAKDLTNADGTALRLIGGGIAATNYVLKVQEHELFEAITRATGNTVRAVEMESWGAAISGQAYTASSRKGVLLGMVRGLSDIVRPNAAALVAPATATSAAPSSAGATHSRERDGWKLKAAHNAARLVVTWIRHAWPYPAKGLSTGPIVMTGSEAGKGPDQANGHKIIQPSQIPASNAMHGETEFDYSSHNGRFDVGLEELKFETRWSRGSDTTIHCYIDQTNLVGVALPPVDAKLESFKNVGLFDMTSRVHTVQAGQFVVLKNQFGNYALVQVLAIQDRTRAEVRDNLQIRYWIGSAGKDDFSAIMQSGFVSPMKVIAAASSTVSVPGQLKRSASITNPHAVAPSISQNESNLDKPISICCATRNESIRRLQEVSDGSFFKFLLTELKDRLQWQLNLPGGAADLVDRAMALDDPEQIKKLFWGVRQAMKAIDKASSNASEELNAAAALHYLGFRQLVRRNGVAQLSGEFLLPLMTIDSAQHINHQTPQLIIGAIVISAVFGGRVEFELGGLTRNPSHMRKVALPENADQPENAIDRALFGAWFPTDERTPGIVAGSLEMTVGDHSRLKARIEELREGDQVAVGVLVSAGAHHTETYSKIGKKFKIPILQESSRAVEEVLGMDPSDFLAQMGEYWKLDTELRQKPCGTPTNPLVQSTVPKSQGDNAMSVTNYTTTVNNIGPAQNQFGNLNTASQQIQQNGLDPASLEPLMTALGKSIAALTNADAKAAYETDLKILVAETKASAPDKSKISKVLEKLKNAPDYIQGGKAVVDAATGIYNWITPLLGSGSSIV